MERGCAHTGSAKGSHRNAAALQLPSLCRRRLSCIHTRCTSALARKQQPPPEAGDEAGGGGGGGGRGGCAEWRVHDTPGAQGGKGDGAAPRMGLQSGCDAHLRGQDGGASARSGQRGGNGACHHSSRHGGQNGPQSVPRAWDASLGAWARRVRGRCGKRLQPGTLIGLAKNLEAVPGAERAPQAEVAEAVVSLQLLIGNAVQCGELTPAMFLGELAASVEAHKCLHRAAMVSDTFVAAARKAFDAAAALDSTYSDARTVSQLAVAQRRLGLLCERFWRELERREHVALSARGLANVYHAYAALAQQRKAAGAAASDALCSKLEERAVDLKGAFNEQEAANCLWAAATLERRLTSQVRAELLGAAQRTAPGMQPQGIANSLWAIAKLNPAALAGPLRCALLQAAERKAPRMSAQGVSNTLLALATAGIQPRPRLSSALLPAVRQQANHMNDQAVANSMWSLATLQLDTGGGLSERLQEAALQRAPHMNAQAVCNTLWALAYYQTCRSQPAAVALVHALLERASNLEDSILSNVSCCHQVSSPGVTSGLLLIHQCLRIQVQKRLTFKAVQMKRDALLLHVKTTSSVCRYTWPSCCYSQVCVRLVSWLCFELHSLLRAPLLRIKQRSGLNNKSLAKSLSSAARAPLPLQFRCATHCGAGPHRSQLRLLSSIPMEFACSIKL